jgi:hypothetical protein
MTAEVTREQLDAETLPRRGDIVKLRATAQERNLVLQTSPIAATTTHVYVQQLSSGKSRYVRLDRCIVVERAEVAS